MEPVDVAVEATDAFSAAGLASQLQPRSEVRLVAREDMSGRGVCVVAIDRMSSREMGFLHRLGTMPKVLVTDALIDADPLTVLDCGVVAALPRAEAAGERLVASVVAAATERSNATAVLDALAECVRPEPSSPGRTPSGLTSREVDVLRLIADGLATTDIASRLCYSERTVKNVIYALTSRLKLRSRPHAVAYAVRAGLI